MRTGGTQDIQGVTSSVLLFVFQHAAVLAATLPSDFNVQNLPHEVKTRHKNHLDLTFLMTNNNVQPFPTAKVKIKLRPKLD